MKSNDGLFRGGILLIFFLLFVTGINPYDRTVWILESLTILIGVIILIGTHKKFRFSNGAYLMIFFYLVVATIGAYYTYDNVPLEWLSDVFGWQRNNHDRIVHFLSGFLLVIPVKEIVCKTLRIRNNGRFSIFVFSMLMLGFGALYEIIEWIIALRIAPGSAGVFLGMQGDVWDSQKDMIMMFLGSLLSLTIAYFRNGPMKNVNN